MQLSFDLISDFHLETWPEFDWTNQATSPIAVVAGDIARDRDQVVECAKKLAKNYHLVMYIDGNDEHKYYYNDLAGSYKDLARRIKKIKKLCYMQDNVVVLNGVAFLATNGWFTFDFDEKQDFDTTTQQWMNNIDGLLPNLTEVSEHARTDAAYLYNSVAKLQRHHDVKKIVVITHTVPDVRLIQHDLRLTNNWRFNCMGNSLMTRCLSVDTEKKISAWCFGHYHGPVDRVLDGVRFVNNCRGRGDTDFRQVAYYPRRITIDY